MLALGHLLDIVFTVETTVKTGDIILEVSSVERCPISSISPFSWPSSELEKLYKNSRESPWSFVRYFNEDSIIFRGP